MTWQASAKAGASWALFFVSRGDLAVSQGLAKPGFSRKARLPARDQG